MIVVPPKPVAPDVVVKRLWPRSVTAPSTSGPAVVAVFKAIIELPT